MYIDCLANLHVILLAHQMTCFLKMSTVSSAFVRLRFTQMTILILNDLMKIQFDKKHVFEVG